MSNERQQRAARAEQMRKEREKADRKQRNLITVGIVVVVVALIAVAGFAIKQTNDKNKTVEDVINPVHVTKDYGIDYTTEVATGKPATAPVKVIAYEDFQCPACLNFEQQSGAFLADAVAKGDITVEYRPLAFLDRSSNGNRYSSRSGSAAMCVLDKSGVKAFKKMHDVLYANQPEENTAGPEDAELIADATQGGVTGIDASLPEQLYAPWVRKAKAAAFDDGHTGTPTILIDGKSIAPTQADIRAAIAAA